MLRRAAGKTAVGARAVSSYNFGHPDMATDFLPSSHYVKKTEPADKGVRVSKLPNGVRVISHDREGPHVAVGTYIEAGPKFDQVGIPGLSHVLRYALSADNLADSAFQLDRNIRSVGAANSHVEVRKRFIGLKLESGAGSWERVAQDQWTTVVAPRFADAEINRYRDTMDNELEEQRWQNPREYCIDQLETVAFYREPLGNPRRIAPEINDKADRDHLIDQWARLCVPSRIVIAGVNVDHDSLIAAYENTVYQHSKDAPHHARSGELPAVNESTEADQYYAGNEFIEPEFRTKAMLTKPHGDEESIFAVGFLAPGADNNVKQYAAALVARELASIAFGETLAVNRHDSRFGVESFYRPFSSAGLIGATIRSAPGDAKGLLAETAAIFRKLAPTTETLTFAKARAIARLANEVDATRDYLDFLGTSLVSDSLNHISVNTIAEAITSTDAKAVSNVLDLAKAHRPTLFGTGDVLAVPSLRKLGL